MRRARKRIRARLRYIQFVFCVLMMILVIVIIKSSFARYRSSATSNANVDLAYYVFQDQDISQDLKLDSILPRQTPYNYTLLVKNNDGQRRTETAIQYSFEIKATTNLPLNYSFYNSQDLTNNLVLTSTTSADSDGTYFKNITASGGNFGFQANEQATYILQVEFPEEYNEAQYEGIIEYIQITLKSNQRIE